jgi:hypothetical protein
MKPTHAWHLDHPAWLGGCILRGVGALSFAKTPSIAK